MLKFIQINNKKNKLIRRLDVVDLFYNQTLAYRKEAYESKKEYLKLLEQKSTRSLA